MMGSAKDRGKKRRLMVESKISEGVPTWVVLRTKMKVRTNPQRRNWRRNKLKL